ncbi:hypothetical protein [Georgenia sp. SUBG003]|uniref:hypothetical protein n=1 Tax=Georgenia sp. SUBG003 TaxID=1497974 RepID=UPI003AB2F8A8
MLIYYVASSLPRRGTGESRTSAIYVFTGLTVWQPVQRDRGRTERPPILAQRRDRQEESTCPARSSPLAHRRYSALFNFVIQLAILIVAALTIRGLVLDSRLLYLPAALAVTLVWAPPRSGALRGRCGTAGRTRSGRQLRSR